MMRTPVDTPSAPSAIGPYSQAITTSPGRLLFCSGQIAIDPKTGELVGAGDARAQTRRVMENLQAVVQAAGGRLENIVKTTIFLADLQDFGHVNDVYGTFFPAAPPARSTVEVQGLPKGALVEIEAIAVLADS